MVRTPLRKEGGASPSLSSLEMAVFRRFVNNSHDAACARMYVCMYVAVMHAVCFYRPHGLEQYSPRITEAYILSRLGLVEAVLRGDTDDPLDDYDSVEIQIKQVAVIARCQFDTTCQYIISVFDPLVAHYTAMLASGAVDPNNPQYLVLDGKLTWLMFVLGAVVGTRTQISPSESYDAIDADLICRALNLMKILDQRLAAGFPPIGERLNVAILTFLQHFRVSFVGDTVPRHGLMYQKLVGERPLYKSFC